MHLLRGVTLSILLALVAMSAEPSHDQAAKDVVAVLKARWDAGMWKDFAAPPSLVDSTWARDSTSLPGIYLSPVAACSSPFSVASALTRP